MKIWSHIVPAVLMSAALFLLGGCSGDAKKGRVTTEQLNDGTAADIRKQKEAACVARGGEVSGEFCTVGNSVEQL
jgi:hypothetical protein